MAGPVAPCFAGQSRHRFDPGAVELQCGGGAVHAERIGEGGVGAYQPACPVGDRDRQPALVDRRARDRPVGRGSDIRFRRRRRRQAEGAQGEQQHQRSGKVHAGQHPVRRGKAQDQRAGGQSGDECGEQPAGRPARIRCTGIDRRGECVGHTETAPVHRDFAVDLRLHGHACPRLAVTNAPLAGTASRPHRACGRAELPSA